MVWWQRAESAAAVAGSRLVDLLELPLSRLQFYSSILQQLVLVSALDPGEEE